MLLWYLSCYFQKLRVTYGLLTKITETISSSPCRGINFRQTIHNSSRRYVFPLFRHVARTIHRWIVRFSRVEPSRAISHFRLTKLSTSDISMKHGKLDRYTVGPRTWVVHLRLLFDSSHGGDPKDTNQHQPLNIRARTGCPKFKCSFYVFRLC